MFPWLEPAPEEAYSPPAWKGTNARSHTDIVRYGSTTAPLRNQSPRAFRYGCSRDRVAWQTNWPHLSPFRSQAGEAGWMSSAARAARLVRQVRARAKHPPRLSWGFCCALVIVPMHRSLTDVQQYGSAVFQSAVKRDCIETPCAGRRISHNARARRLPSHGTHATRLYHFTALAGHNEQLHTGEKNADVRATMLDHESLGMRSRNSVAACTRPPFPCPAASPARF